jgi:hypothetical protein
MLFPLPLVMDYRRLQLFLAAVRGSLSPAGRLLVEALETTAADLSRAA